MAKCMAASLSATVALVLLFFPKIYVIVFHPEKNVRSSFTTADGIRCHIGGVGKESFSIVDSTDGLVSVVINHVIGVFRFIRRVCQSTSCLFLCFFV